MTDLSVHGIETMGHGADRNANAVGSLLVVLPDGAEALYRTLVEQIPAITYIQRADETGTLLYISPQVEAVLGYPPTELVGRITLWTQHLHPDDLAAVMAEDAHTDATGEPFHCEYRLQSPDGRYVWFRDEAVLLRDEGDRPLFWQGVMLDVTAQKTAEAALREAEERYRTLVERLPAITYVLRLDADAATPSVLFLSPQSETILGYPPEAWDATPDLWARIVHPDDRERVLAAVAAAEAAGAPIRQEYRLLARDGRTVWVRDESVLMADNAGGPRLRHGVVLDVTDRREAEEAVQRSEAALAEAQRLARLGSWELDLATGEGWWSAESYRTFGVVPGEGRLTQERYMESVHPDDRQRLEAVVGGAVVRGGEVDFEYRIVRPDGSERTLLGRAAVVRDDAGRAIRLVGTNQDVTERKALEEQLRHQAFHDALTGLPNRALLMDRIEHALELRARGAHSAAVLFLDLDDFKVVNDGLGHDAGDRLLSAVAERLRVSTRSGDTVARFGGDEFIVLLEDLDGADEAAQAAERIADALRPPVDLNGRPVFVTSSVGIATSTASDHAGDLLRRADVAMYEAKRGGKARWVLFEAGMDERVRARLRLEGELRRALEAGEFVVHYQPLVELATGRVVEVEALVRWQHPDRGLVTPDEIVPIAEQTGLIVPLGRWVLEEACRRVRAWHLARPREPALALSVNVSVRQLQDPNLVADVARVLAATGFPPRLLKLEVTESVAMNSEVAHVAVLRELKGLGVRLAVDDFGTGYSALSYLRRCPVDALKIDRSYVAGLGRDPEDETIVRAIVAFGRAMGLEVTAEGVETVGQLSQLRALGCELGQGYHFARPLPLEALEALLPPGAEQVVATAGAAVNPTREAHRTA